MRGLRDRFTTLLLLGSVTACAGTGSSVATPPPEASGSADSLPASAAIQVQVDNQGFSDMNVYLVRGGGRWLVGQVTGLTKATLAIPVGISPANMQVRLLAVPIGSRNPIATPTLTVPHGQRIYWMIGSNQAMSTASVG